MVPIGGFLLAFFIRMRPTIGFYRFWRSLHIRCNRQSFKQDFEDLVTMKLIKLTFTKKIYAEYTQVPRKFFHLCRIFQIISIPLIFLGTILQLI